MPQTALDGHERLEHRMTQHRTQQRRLTIVTLLAAASLALAGCSGATPSAPADSAAPAANETPEPAESTGASEAAADPDAGVPIALVGVVGTLEDPEAYEIALTDESGEPVTTLPAGDYSLTFSDGSSMHNFHMTGPGGVDVSTDVAGTDVSTVSLTLSEGTYEYVCDPHVASMNGSLEVTG
jgi:ABC-type Fe3+-hydroxamate transport system substrate-binding protein